MSIAFRFVRTARRRGIGNIASSILILLRQRGLHYLGYLIRHQLPARLGRHLVLLAPMRRRKSWALGVVLTAALILFGLVWALSSAVLGIVAVLLSGCVIYGFVTLRARRRLAQLLAEASGSHGARNTGAPPLDTVPFADHQDIGLMDAIVAASPDSNGDVVLAEIDQDGRQYPKFAALADFEVVSAGDFLPRTRSRIDIVWRNDAVLLRKSFLGHRQRLILEWCCLEKLSGVINVPAVHEADVDGTRLYLQLVPGVTLRDKLAQAGARICNRHTDGDAALARLSPEDRATEVAQRAAPLLSTVAPETFYNQLEQQLERAHAAGIVGLDIKYGNVIVHSETGEPWLIDFEGAKVKQSNCTLLSRYFRNFDRHKFNGVFGRHLHTEESVTQSLAQVSDQIAKVTEERHWYAPIDFGNGITVGDFWKVESGTGRWEYLNGAVLAPLLKGKRVLDLGCNIGLMPMLMLRAGASGVVGVELQKFNVETAQLIHDIFEWTDQTRYDLHVHHGNILDVLDQDFGRFDVTTAYCSLYYVEADEMAKLVRRAAELSDMMILQANIVAFPDAEKSARAQTEFLRQLLMKNGFPEVEVHAPKDFQRPLLIGRKSASI